MSKLIDMIVDLDNPKTQIDGKWYLAKPLPFYGFFTIIDKIKDCIRILKGKSFAVHYKEDF